MATLTKARKRKRTRQQPSEQPVAEPVAALPWWRTTWSIAGLGGLLFYAAFPPWNLWLLGWVALAPWLWLIKQDELPGRRPYRSLYLVGVVHWAVLLYWVTYGHWAAHFGWIALSLYLGAYLPAFVGLSRVAVRRLRVPFLIAAATVWAGLEVARGWLFTGLGIAMLGHTQVDFLPIIQIADTFGGYGVSFVMVLTTAGLVDALIRYRGESTRRSAGWPIAAALTVVVLTFGYGYWRMASAPSKFNEPPVTIALVQGANDATFGDPELDKRMWNDYLDLTVSQAVPKQPSLAVWPESTFPYPRFDVKDLATIQPSEGEASFAEFRDWVTKEQTRYMQVIPAVAWVPGKQRLPIVLGGSTYELGPHEPRRYNTAIYVDQRGQEAGVYHKMHPVMFGEYVPFGDWFPWVYTLTPFGGGLSAGESPTVFEVDGLKLAPSICYENTLPHLIRRQVDTLHAEGDEPDVLLTISNDGWFRGSAGLDMHLTCGRFRAVEMRKPALIAANTGFSAHVDGSGRLLAKGPRRAEKVIFAEVHPDGRQSPHRQIGDWPGNLCLLFCVVAGIAGLRRSGLALT